MFLALTVGLFGSVQADDKWPERPVNVVVPFGAGGSTDLVARLLAQHLREKFNQPFVVENRGGAGGSIGTAHVVKSAPDGYTMLIGTVSSSVINPLINKNAQYDALKDLQPVSLLAKLPNMLVVRPDLPVRNIQELIAYAKKNPGKLSYGSSGPGTSSHLSAELFLLLTDTKMVHIPFKSTAEVVSNLRGGHIDLAFDNMTVIWPQVQSGELRALAVTTPERNATAPNVPAIAETIKGYEATAWQGIFMPAGTPKSIVDRVALETARILKMPEVANKLKDLGADSASSSPKEFADYITVDRERWDRVTKATGLSVR
jgi:tripartite-type tricarboxylate transporter receptor subunit TctC